MLTVASTSCEKRKHPEDWIKIILNLTRIFIEIRPWFYLIITRLNKNSYKLNQRLGIMTFTGDQ